MSKFQDYNSSISYFSMLRERKKYNELCCGHVAYISMFITGLIILIISFWDLQFVDRFEGLLTAIIGGLLGLLGFLITGLSILASIITTKATIEIDKRNSAQELIGLLFSFYFSGSLTAIGVFLAVIDYLIIKIDMPFSWWLFIPLEISTAYLVIFSILYAVGLLGTCINVFLLNVQWNRKD
ncbi:MAG: hypothetical protein H6Q70_500 [Firmicutes bacterium]|nr:hypothetical protein [Bacillota bacterium]